MPQHKKLSLLPLRLPPIPSDIPPPMRQYLQQLEQAIQSNQNAQAQLDLCSGLTSFTDATNSGYFLGFTKNDTGYSDGVPVFVVGDRSAEKYFEFDGDDIRIGASTQFQGADAYNNETTYYHTFFDSLDNATTSGTPSFDASTGSLEIEAGDTAYKVCENSIGAFSFETGTVRMKFAYDIATFPANWGGSAALYIMTGSRIGTNSGFGFKWAGNGAGGATLHGFSNRGGTETLTSALSSDDSPLEAVLTAGEKIEFYANGVKQGEITDVSDLPIDGAGKGVQSQRCLYYFEGTATSPRTILIGEYRLLHERNS